MLITGYDGNVQVLGGKTANTAVEKVGIGDGIGFVEYWENHILGKNNLFGCHSIQYAGAWWPSISKWMLSVIEQIQHALNIIFTTILHIYRAIIITPNLVPLQTCISHLIWNHVIILSFHPHFTIAKATTFVCLGGGPSILRSMPYTSVMSSQLILRSLKTEWRPGSKLRGR